MKEKVYRVYEHLFPNGKRYIGYTSRSLHGRFQRDGRGYQFQPLIWNAIQKYGWGNIAHKQIGLFNDEKSAKNFETKCIRKYNTSNPKYGYNIIECDEDRANKEINRISDALLSCNSRAYRKLKNAYCYENYNLFDTRKDYFHGKYYDNPTYCEFRNRSVGDLIVYHRFISGEFSGLIYIDVYIDQGLHSLSEKEFNRRKDDRHFREFLLYVYGITKKDLSWDSIKDKEIKLQNDSTKIVYSLLDGSYFIENEDSINNTYKDNITVLLSMLRSEYEFHRKLKHYYYETKDYLCTDDNYMLRQSRKELFKFKRKIKNNGITK